MSRTATIAKNTLVQVTGRAIGTILGLVTLGVMTRYLGATGYGEFTTITTFLQFFGIIVDFGLSLTTVAMLAEADADPPSPDGPGRASHGRALSNLMTLRVVSAAAFFAAAPLVALFFPYNAEIKAGIAVGAFSFFLISINQVLTGVLQKEMRMGRAAAAEVIGRIGLLACVAAVASSRLPLVWMIAALIVGNALTAFWNWLLVRKIMPYGWAFDREVWRRIVKRSWPIGASIVFNLVYLKGDVLVMSLTRPQSEVGLYGAAYKILDVLTVVPIMFMGLVLPLLVKAWAERSAADWNRILQKAFDFMAVMALPIVAGTWVVGRGLMRFVAGSGFDQSGSMLGILIIAAGSVFFGSMFGHAIIAVHKQRAMIWGYAADAALSLTGYVLLIPRWGPVAAAWVTVFSEAFIALATYWMIRRATGFSPKLGVALKAAFSAALMAAAVAVLPPGLHVLIKVAIGAAVYAILAFMTGTVSKETVRELLPKPVFKI